MNERIHEFASRHFDIFRNPSSSNIQVEEGFADECFSLGFKMDCGDSFCEKYNKAFNDAEELDKIIDEIDDPLFLGTAIFSQWRYITHWSYNAHPLDSEYRPWFIIAFSRLATITSEDNYPPYVFHGNVKKIKINSNCVCYGPRPEENDEIEQHITITDNGRVWISRYAFGDGFGNYKKIEQKQYRVSAEKVAFLFDKFTRYFKDQYQIDYVTDVGSFEMTITDDQGKTVSIIGPLMCQFEVDGYDLSQLLRDTVNDQTLFVFDGNTYEKIKRITIEYNGKQVIVSENVGEVIINSYDKLVIDRESDTIEDFLQVAEECDITRKYHVAEGIRSFLDNYEHSTIFTEFEETEDLSDVPEGTPTYRITVEFYREEPRVIEGKYYKYGLPTDWPEFIENLYNFISFYGVGEMFSQDVYGKTFPKDNDIIFLSVRFGDYGKPYYYITNDDSIEVGVQVVVPVGNDGAERIVDVIKKQYFSADKVPMPLDKVKPIVGKFVPPVKDESGKRMIYCPMCECDIDAEDCYDILYDPCSDGIEGVITKEQIIEKDEICQRCRYHEE